MKSGRVNTLATSVALGLIDMDLLWERARSETSPGGVQVVDSETDEIEAAYKQFRPDAGCLAQTVEVCVTGLTAAHGVFSDGFVKKITPLKRGMNVSELYPEIAA